MKTNMASCCGWDHSLKWELNHLGAAALDDMERSVNPPGLGWTWAESSRGEAAGTAWAESDLYYSDDKDYKWSWRKLLYCIELHSVEFRGSAWTQRAFKSWPWMRTELKTCFYTFYNQIHYTDLKAVLNSLISTNPCSLPCPRRSKKLIKTTNNREAPSS